MMKTIHRIALTLSTAMIIGCGSSTEEVLAREQVAPLRQKADEAAGDRPAADQGALLRAAFDGGRSGELKFPIYRLAAVDDKPEASIQARAEALLGVAGDTKIEVRSHGVVTLDKDNWRLLLSGASGYEFLSDDELFHKERGVTEDKLLTDAEYLDRAQGYIAQSFGSVVKAVELRPYKVWKYINEDAEKDGPVLHRTVYQVSVSYNMFVGDVPVIGSGGKIIVHMATDGKIVAHESTVRPLQDEVVTATGAEIVSPKDAQSNVETRLKARGVELSDFRLTREEFGYLRNGRNSIQSVLAPYYAYFYEPLDGVVGRKIVEVELATTNKEVMELVRSDEDRESERKRDRVGNQPPPGKK